MKNIIKTGIFVFVLTILLSVSVNAETEKQAISIETKETLQITATTKNQQLKITTDPAGAKLTFHSSDKKIAVIDKAGKVTGKSSGNAGGRSRRNSEIPQILYGSFR